MRLIWLLVLGMVTSACGDEWPQLQGDAAHSGNAVDVELSTSMGLVGSVPMTDAIFASPIVADGLAYVMDGSGAVTAVDLKSMHVAWRFQTEGGAANCNNVAAPALSGEYLHLGTMSGFYYVLHAKTGRRLARHDFGEPVFSTPIVGTKRVYAVTLGAQAYALTPEGKLVWKWDFVREVVNFQGNRWSGAEWLKHRGDRVTWRDHFVCSRDACLIHDDTLVIPAGGRTVFLKDHGDSPKLQTLGLIPRSAGSEYPATFGQSADQRGNVFVQWHRRDNAGRVEMMQLNGDQIRTSFVPGSDTSIRKLGLLSFAPVSISGRDIYRVRPESGVGLCRHTIGADRPVVLSPQPAISPPVITKNHILYGGLDGKLHLANVKTKAVTSLATAFGSPISAPLAVAAGKILVGCEDGYLYVFGEGGKQPMPTKSLELWKSRSQLSGKLASDEFNWYTNYGDFGGSNSNDQGLAPPLRMRWVRRLEGTVKHLPVCGGGRMYMHTAEGQVLAVEQDTGRLLWRRYWPDVYLSFTSPLYYDGKLIVPQAGIKRSMMRCLDAATGKLLWEAPFTGSPSWSRQFPPVVHDDIAIYASSTGEYAAQGSERFFTFGGTPVDHQGKEVMSWIYSNDNPYYPKNHRPRVWAWNINTGKIVWERDFSEYGRGGNDCGICIHQGKFYYSTFFGYAASKKSRRGLPDKNNGLTACMDPKTGKILWKTTDYFVTSKCTLSSRDGRIYIGGNNRAREETNDRFVWCLDAKNGALIWKSDAVTSALNVVSVGKRFIFSNALRGKGNIYDQKTGKVYAGIQTNYACCRFTLSEPYVLGANMDMIDLSQGGKLVSTGPAIDSRECLGAVVSNGRVFYMSQASGFVVSQTFGPNAGRLPPVWENRKSPHPDK